MTQLFAQPLVVLQVIGGAFCALLVGSVLRLSASRRDSSEAARSRRDSLRTWWILCVVVAIAVSVGTAGVSLLMTVVSALAMIELQRLVAVRSVDRAAGVVVLLILMVHYGLAYLGHVDAAAVFIPLVLPTAVAVVQILQGETSGFLRSTAGLVWGGLFLIYGLSHCVLLLHLPETRNGAAGPTGWFLYLLLLTGLNDISQAVIGRRFGNQQRHRISPTVSPNKTWEGFIGGAFTTVVASFLLAPLLTTLNDSGWLMPLSAGLLVAVSGFLGDINMSALKRDAGVKDSGTLLPGMGGMIDRIDSLTWTAPAFYYFVAAISQ